MFVHSSPRQSRAGFTLIELLVVIAIIAILAAILFPVFAQARQAARGASSLSNVKQISLGTLMYVQDYDETFPLFQSWGPGGQVCWNGCAPNNIWTQWTFEITPYLKNAQVFADPLYGSSALDPWNQSIFPDYGYNYTTLSRSLANTSPWQFPGTTNAAINQPASTVMFTGRFDSKEGGTWWYGAGTMLNIGNAEAPDCSDIPALCWTDWAPNGNDGTCCVNLPTLESGKYTGGDSVRKSGTMNVGLVDGHAKFMQPSQVAAGTNWHQGSLAGTIHITDATQYMWQVVP
jgi:prepilin-type N-terminal cleavage/methylation domain-containing protein